MSAAITVGTVGTYVVAAGIGACALSNAGEILTGTNVIRDELMGGNHEAYETVQTAFNVVGCGTVIIGQTNPGVAGNAPKASRGSTGRTEPFDLREQLAMEQVKSNPSAGTQLTKITLTDPRWPSSEGWVKMQHVVSTSQEEINIHYVYNQDLKIFDDFKFKCSIKERVM